METATAQGVQRALQAALGGHYVLERELGRGGMATVYLAHDQRHRRRVAVKVLHAELSAALGPDRFLREIELTAALQHPHILPLFDSGRADGLLYYVMPYVSGETLRARLAREGPLPIEDALRIATEMASALEYAHRHGVVHRDVKPENVLLADDGQALVADFGIALAAREAAGPRITQTGISLGTPQYMAPEQALGERAVDARADVYALGAVTYEMLAGVPPFTGTSTQAVVTKLMTEEPAPPTRLRRSVPPHVEAAVLHALAKLPADRPASAAAFAAALANASPTALPAPRRTDVRPVPPRTVALLAGGALAAGAALGVLGVAARDRATTAAREPVRYVIEPDVGALGAGDWWYSAPAISPDGRTVVYAASSPDGTRLYARRAGDVTPRPIPGTDGGDWPFFSPDGAWIGFASRGAIRRVRLDGSTPTVVTTLPQSTTFFGGTWGADDAIVFTLFPSGALHRVAAGGGPTTPIARADTTRRLLHPQLLPGGRAVLVTASIDWRVGRIAVLDLATGRLRRFGPGTGARYVNGHIVYAGSSGELFRQPFDLQRLTPTGPPEEIANGLDVFFAAYSPLDVSASGALVYRVSRGGWTVTLTDRTGRELQTLPGRFAWAPRFSPDGRRVAYAAAVPGQETGDLWSSEVWRTDIWITDVASGTARRLTTDGNDNSEPVWSPDGRTMAYDAGLLGEKDVFVRPLDGGGARRITQRPGNQWPQDWTRDGRAVLFTDSWPRADDDVWIQPVDGGAARPYLMAPSYQNAARVSPDGRWVAYNSNETGRTDVFLTSFPTPGEKILVSSEGGDTPAWRADGRELYYWQGDQLIAVTLDAGRAGAPPVVRGRTPLFRPSLINHGYDVSPDGTRFVVLSRGPRATRLVVALDALGVRAGP